MPALERAANRRRGWNICGKVLLSYLVMWVDVAHPLYRTTSLVWKQKAARETGFSEPWFCNR